MSARMTNIREQDLDIYESSGELWVAANSGGISTFSSRGRGKNWWRLDEGINLPVELRVVNDYGNHYLWEPSYAMPLEEFTMALSSIGELFYKVS